MIARPQVAGVGISHPDSIFDWILPPWLIHKRVARLMHDGTMEESMPDKSGGPAPEQYEETTSPANPPLATAGAATVVAGMWYYLAPAVLLVAVLFFAIFYWFNRDEPRDNTVEPTTGISDDSTPGGRSADPKLDDTKDEQEFRGGNR